MTHPLVSLKDIRKTFGVGEAAVRALDGVSLDVAPGEVVGLLGPSGSGKSTLLNVIACILPPDTGHFEIDGAPIWTGRYRINDLRRLRRERIGFIFQFHNLLPFLSAVDNVALALEVGVACRRIVADEQSGEVDLPVFLGQLHQTIHLAE